MFWSFIIFIISLILKIGAQELSKTYDFLIGWLPYFNGIFIASIVMVVIFVLIEVFRHLKK
ncbi:MAG: hypothetical protein IKT32_07710 [Clostridia bacterium]|nr:hypothetical protein [Clostridia bacterium]